MTKVIIGIGLAVAGVVLALIVAPIVRRFLTSKKRPEAVREVAAPMASFVFWMLVAAGLLGAVAQASPDTLKPMPASLIRYMPRVLVAGIMLIAGMVVGQVVSLAVGRATLKASGKPAPGIERIVKAAVIGLFALLAVGQLGINTTIINMLVGALLFSLSLSSALVIGLGGRDLARQLTAGRYLRNIVAPGAVVEAGELSGVVVALHPASFEVRLDDGSSVHMPNALMLSNNLRIVMPAPERVEK